MSLPSAIQTSRRPTLRITWMRTNGEFVDLTGANLSGIIQNKSTLVETAISGVLTVVDATQGAFTWAFGTTDVASSANYYVQFKATYTDSTFELSMPESWEVVSAL